jgi:hypothetical protein
MRDPLQRLYRTKLAFLATVFTCLGIALLVGAHLAAGTPGWTWLADLPVSELGGTLFTTGLVVVAFEYLDGQDAETRAAARLRAILKEQAPAMRDAVIDGFAFDSDDLARVSSPEVLDQISRNALAIQLGDRGFAEAVYGDLREQTLRGGERRKNLRVRMSLSHWERGSGSTRTRMLAVTATWEFTVIPTEGVRRFICVSDPAEYRELSQASSNALLWQFVPADGLDGGSPEAFELLQLSVDGADRPIRRTARAGSQTYTATVGKSSLAAGQPVKISYTYRTLVRAGGHLLHLRMGKPTHGVRIEVDYTGSGIQDVSVLDFMASSEKPTISKSPAEVPERTVALSFDGWALPASGVAFVWTNEDRTVKSKRG